MAETKPKDNILTLKERQALKGMGKYWDEVFQRDNHDILSQECQQVYALIGHRMLSIIMFYLKETLEGNGGNTMTETKYTAEQDREHVEYAWHIQRDVVQRLLTIIDRLEAENTTINESWETENFHSKQVIDCLEAEKAELVKFVKEIASQECCGSPGCGIKEPFCDPMAARVLLAKHEPK